MPVHFTNTKATLFTWNPRRSPPRRGSHRQADDPTGGIPVQPLGEEWFEGQENLQLFETPNTVLPYYLVNSGRSLIFGDTTPAQSSPTALQILQTAVEELKQETPVFEQVASSSNLRSSPRPEAPEHKSPHIDADTTLSSIATSISEQEHTEGYSDHDSNRDETCSGIENGPKNNISQKGQGKESAKAVPAELIINQVWKSPIGVHPIPLMLQFEFHREIFQPSINESHSDQTTPTQNRKALIKNTGRDQDICINVFYNGELTHSRNESAEKPKSALNHATRRVDFSGRRVHYTLEVPWAICKVENNAPITDSSFEQRWNEVNQMLATEADKWGRAGKISLFRSPMGEYLEAMSKLPMPKGAVKWNERGGRAGIIDLVVTTGRQFSAGRDWCDADTRPQNLVEPVRKLYRGHIGKKEQFHVVIDELFAANTKQHVNKALTTDGTSGFGEHHTVHEAAESHEGFGLDGSGSKSKRNAKAQTFAINPPSGSPAKRKRSVGVPTSQFDEDGPLASIINSETANTHGAGPRRSSRGKSESLVAVAKTADESVSDYPRPQKRSKPEIEKQPASSPVAGYSGLSSSNTIQKFKNLKSKNSAASKPTGRPSLRKKYATLTVPSHDSPAVEEHTTLPRDGSSTFSKSPAEQHPTQSDPATDPDKKKRAPSRAVSTRELSSLLKPRRTSEKSDKSFSPFSETQASNGLVRRKSNKKQSKRPNPKELQPTAAHPPGVTDIFQGPVIKFKDKGINCIETENSRPDILANSTKAEEPIEKAENTIETTKASQAKKKAAGNTDKSTKFAPTPLVEETRNPSNRLANITDNSPIVHDSSSGTSTLTKIASEAESSKGSDNSVTKPATTKKLLTAYPSIAKPKENPKSKSNLNINPSLANKRSYSENSQGLKTPTPKTDTFDVRKATDSNTLLQPAVPSLFDNDTNTSAGALRTKSAHAWGLREQLSPDISPGPLAQHDTQPPLPVMNQQNRDRTGKVKDSNTSVLSISEDKKGRCKEIASQIPVPQHGEIDEGTETVVPARTLRLRNIKGKGTESIGSTNGEDGPTLDGDVFVRNDLDPQPWTPNSICQDSLLTYGGESFRWENMKYEKKSRRYCRKISTEKEGLFRASGVLFGVRFVVGLGADESEPEAISEARQPGAENSDIDVGSVDTEAEEENIYDA